jgi:MFS family permease
MNRVSTYAWFVFSVLAVAYTLVHFHRLCPAVVAVDIMRDLGTSGAITGLLASAYFYSGAVMQLPAGLLSDSLGPRKTITLFLIVAALGSAVLGLAPNPAWAIAGRTLVGVGVAMVFVPVVKVLAEWFPPERFATMTGVLMAMGGIGALLAATPLVWLTGAMGWRGAFVAVGVFTLGIAGLTGIFVRNRPADLGLTSPAHGAAKADPPMGLAAGVKQVLGCRHFWPLAAWFFFTLGIYFSFAALWGGPYLMHVYGMSRENAGQILTLMAVGLVVGSPLLSFFSDRVLKRRKPVIVLSSFVLLGITGLLAFRTDQIPTTGIVPLFFLMSVCSSAIVVIGFAMNKELFPNAITGTATGLVNLFPFAGGALFQPVLGQILESHGRHGDAFTVTGYQAAFQVLFIAAILALLASLFTKETLVSRP